MPFIGNQPAEAYSSFQKQDFTTSATTSYTLDHPVANGNEIALFINFVRQEPTAAYTASGTSLTLTSATTSSDDMYCVFLGKAVQTVNPPNSSVGTSQLSSSLDFSSKTITLASNMKNTPAFSAKSSAQQTATENVTTLLAIDTENYDTDGAYDNTSSNYKFTVPSGKAGKYVFYAAAIFDAAGAAQLQNARIAIYKNGSIVKMNTWNFNSNDIYYAHFQITHFIDLSASDYIEAYTRISDSSGSPVVDGSAADLSEFSGFRIGT